MLTGHWSRVPRPIVLGLMLAAVVAMVLVRASVLVGCDLVAGAFAAWSLSAASRAFLFGLEPPDPLPSPVPGPRCARGADRQRHPRPALRVE